MQADKLAAYDATLASPNRNPNPGPGPGPGPSPSPSPSPSDVQPAAALVHEVGLRGGVLPREVVLN